MKKEQKKNSSQGNEKINLLKKKKNTKTSLPVDAEAKGHAMNTPLFLAEKPTFM